MIVKNLVMAACAALLVPFAASRAPAVQGESWDRTLTWTMTPAGNGASDQVQLSLRHGDGRSQSHYSRNFALSDLEGIGLPSFVAGDGGPVRFRIVREAGALDCEGSIRGGRGNGECRFSPDEGFAAELARRGIGRPTTAEQFHLAMSDVGRPLLNELERENYPRPRVSDLVALGIHGADVDYLRGMDAAGYRVDSLDGLVGMRIHGVTPQYVAELASLGGAFRGIAADQLLAMRIHGVTPGFARAMTELGYGGTEPRDLVGMRIHGMTEEKVRELAALGYRDLSADMLTQMAIHDVSPAYVREMAEAGYSNLTPRQLVNLRIHNVRPDDARDINAAVADD